MATEQEREAVAKHLCAAYFLLPVDEMDDEWKVQPMAAHCFRMADAAIALRDKALQDAAERVRGLKQLHHPSCPKTRKDTRTVHCICGEEFQSHNAAVELAAQEVNNGKWTGTGRGGAGVV